MALAGGAAGKPLALVSRARVGSTHEPEGFAAPTFGGGLNNPWEDPWIDFRYFYASLGP